MKQSFLNLLSNLILKNNFIWIFGYSFNQLPIVLAICNLAEINDSKSCSPDGYISAQWAVPGKNRN